MDRKKMKQQAQVLRSKRASSSRRVVINSKGFIKLNKPLPRKPKDVNLNPPVAANARRLRAERLLEQRKNIQARREARGEKPVGNDALIMRPERVSKGCAGCGRKRK